MTAIPLHQPVVDEPHDADLIRRSLRVPERFALLSDRYATQLHSYAARRLRTGAAEVLERAASVVSLQSSPLLIPVQTSGSTSRPAQPRQRARRRGHRRPIPLGHTIRAMVGSASSSPTTAGWRAVSKATKSVMTATSPTDVVVLGLQRTNTTPLVEGPTIRLTNVSGPLTAGL